MNNRFFWKNWSSTEKNLYQVFLLILCLTLVYFGYVFFRGNDSVLHWNVMSELDEIPTILNKFSNGALQFTINGNAYLVKEQFLASNMGVNPLSNYLFLGVFVLILPLLITSLTTLKFNYFLGGMTLLTAVLVSFHFEVVEVFGFSNHGTFLVIFVLIVGVAYYFHAFGTSFSFIKRFFILLTLTLLIGFTVIWGSHTTHPSIFLSSYALLSALVLSVIFIWMISHEIMAALVWVVSTATAKGRNAVGQFFIIGSIYLLNIFLVFLKNTNAIDWGGLIISPFLIFLLSLFLGIWGFKKYCESGNFIDFRGAGAYLYIGLGIICLATMAFGFVTANDSLIDFFADIISYTHLVMGLAFFIHVLVNFIRPMQKGLEVHKVLYKPIFSPLLIARLIGLIVIIALLGMKHYFPIYQALAGYNNAIADAYLIDNQPLVAEVYYKKAIRYDFQNHKSNYSMASLAVQSQDEINAEYFFKQALLKNPSEYAFIGRTQALLQENRYFEAMFNLKDGLKLFPKSVELLTNLAYLHARAKGGNDSTLYYLNEAKKYCSTCDIPNSNLVAFYAKNKDTNALKPLIKNFKSDYLSANVNYLAAANLLNQKAAVSSELKLSKDSILNVSQLALLYNTSVRTAEPTSRFSNNLIQKLIQKDGNTNFVEDLLFSQTCNNYYGTKKLEGIKQLAQLAQDSTAHKPLYNRMVGMWFLQQGVFDKAVEYLAKSGDKSSVSILESQNFSEIIQQAQEQQASALASSAKTKQDYDAALSKNPLNPLIVKQVASYYNNSLQKPNEAYQILFNALTLNDSSAELWKTYSLQALSMGLREYAEDGLKKLQVLLPATDYKAFLSTYQAKKALMEKNSDGFN